MKISSITWIVFALILLVAGWYFFSSRPSAPSPIQNIAVDDSQNAAVPEAAGAPMAATVVYGQNGFSPSTVTVAKGGVVTFVNQGDRGMWVAADLHPTHEEYDGTTKNQHCPDAAETAFDQCSVSAAYSFTFGKAGTWHYHNHVSAGDIGTVIVR